jgi:hypothetical protein
MSELVGIHRSSSQRVFSSKVVVERHGRHLGVGCGGTTSSLEQRAKSPEPQRWCCTRVVPQRSRCLVVRSSACAGGAHVGVTRYVPQGHVRPDLTRDFPRSPGAAGEGRPEDEHPSGWEDFGAPSAQGATPKPLDVRWFERFQGLFGSCGANLGGGDIVVGWTLVGAGLRSCPVCERGARSFGDSSSSSWSTRDFDEGGSRPARVGSVWKPACEDSAEHAGPSGTWQHGPGAGSRPRCPTLVPQPFEREADAPEPSSEGNGTNAQTTRVLLRR